MGIENGQEIDRDDDDDGLEDFPREKLLEMLKGGEEPADEDTVAFGAGDIEDPAEAATVSVDDGLDLIEKAEKTRRKDADVPAEAKPAASEGDGAVASEGAAPEAKADAAPDDLSELLAGLDEAKREAVAGRVKAADSVLALFKGREADLAAYGATPESAMKDLIEINSYARKNPAEYLAWAATQFGDGAELLGKAAERLGLKVVPAQQDDEDPFEDPKIAEMRAELAALKGQKPQLLGPNDPVHRAQQEIEAFASARPDFKNLGPHIAAMAQSQAQQTGKPVTLADVERFYTAAKAAFGRLDGAESAAPVTSAAQQPAPVKSVGSKAAPGPDAIARAKAASRSLDGSGQGAGRRPALDPNASIEDALSHFAKGFDA